MRMRGWGLGLLFAMAGAMIAAPVAAFAAAPPSTPMTIKTVGFNSSTDTLKLSGINLVSEPYTVAYWGRTTGTSVNERRGTSGNGLWCAMTAYPSGSLRTYGTGLYPKYTRGKAELDLAMLSDYYSVSLNFWYIMSSASPYPALGAADTNSFSVYWDDVASGDRHAVYGFPTTGAAWVSNTQNLSNPSNDAVLSRKAGKLTFQFFDFVEGGGVTPNVGRGTTLDDISVTGFKYGPVNNLSASATGSGIQLSWGTPNKATNDQSADSRTITYRVWRKPASGGDWIELTSNTSRVAGLAYTDSTVASGVSYTYAVQAWDTGIGTGYGSYVTANGTLTDTTAPNVTSNAVANYNNSAAITITATDSGTGVKEIRYTIDGGPTQVVVSSTAVVNVTSAGAHTLRYWAIDNAANVSTTKIANFTITDTQPPTVSSNAAPQYNKVASITISATDITSGVKEIRYTLNGGSEKVVAGSSAVVDITQPGNYTLQYWAVDNSMLQSAKQTRQFSVLSEAVTTERLSARSRFDTAVMIGREGFDPAGNKSWPGVTNIIIASGDDRSAADPLAAAGLVWRYNAPLFLVSAGSPTPASVKTAVAEIAKNGAIKVHVVGGAVAVPDARYDEIKAAIIAAGGSVIDATATSARITGPGGRYGTAARIAQLMSEKADPPVVLIANGADYNKFSDALALSAISAQQGFPIFLVQQGSVPQATLDALKARHKNDRVIVAGGVNTVSDVAALQAAAATGWTWNAANDRWAGQNRYLTATTVATRAIQANWLGSSTIGVAAKLPDALTGGAFVGYRNGVLLLTPSDYLWSDSANWIVSRKASIGSSYVFGGVSSVTDDVKASVDAALQ